MFPRAGVPRSGFPLLLEFPESPGPSKGVGQFLQGVDPVDIGTRLINVAISRAKNQLVILANLSYLDERLPSASIVRDILHDVQSQHRVVSGKELLALRPLESDLKGLIGVVEFDLNASEAGIFNSSTFDAAFMSDVRNAKHSVLIYSAFITPNRVSYLSDLFRFKLEEGVKIRCVTRPPKTNRSVDQSAGKQALDALEQLGCAVDCRSKIHEKLVVVDGDIIWYGSLNVLSHNSRSDETMTRFVNKEFASSLVAAVSKVRRSEEAGLASFAIPENPRCGRCNARSAYYEGKFGPFFRCEDECGWTESLDRLGKHKRKGRADRILGANAGEEKP